MYESGGDGYEVPRQLREVIPNQTGYTPYREFTVHTGGVISTLQDIKLPDTAGGYVYSNPEGSPLLANRTIYWRTMGDVLELSEVSLNFNLLRNRVLYKFQDSPLLDGVSVHESWGHVLILVPTVASVHRLCFPHPTRIMDKSPANSDEDGLLSILSEASVHTARDYEHQLSFPSTSPLPHLCASHFSQGEEEAVFVYCNNQGALTCVKMGNIRGMTSVAQLSSPSSYLLGRVWTSLTSRNNENRDQPFSIVITPVGGVLMLVAVCKDHKLRLWNLQTGDCVSACDLVQFLADPGKEMLQGPQHHQIRLVKQEDKSDETVVSTYLCFQQQAQFLNLSLSYRAGQLDIKPKDTIYCPEFDLVGYSATSRGIAACWTNGEGETLVCRRVKGGGAGWENISLIDTEPNQDLVDAEEEGTADDSDPREVYLTALFAPGVFRAATLAKTIGIFRRNLESVDEFTSWEQLKIEVVSAVEAEIQNNLTDYEISDEDYLAISRAAWSSFYSCASQYRATGLQPMGLVTSPGENTILIVRKDILTWCRPMEALEQVYISGGQGVTAQIFSEVPRLIDSPADANDVLNLLLASDKVGKLLSGADLKGFKEAVNLQKAPDVYSQQLASKILVSQHQVLDQILNRIAQVHNLPKSMETVLYCLELDTGSISKGELDLEKLYTDHPMPRVFASELGISLVSESLRQQVESRLNLSQQLLIMQFILRDCGAKARLSPAVLDAVLSTFLPRTTVMVHCYSVLSWLTQVAVTRPASCLEEINVRQLAVLKIQDKLGAVTYANNDRNTSLLELFLKGPGRVVRVAVGESNGDDCWTRSLTPLINMTAQLLWPRCASPTFLKFLFRSCQHLVVQNYCRLLSTWCEWHPYVRQFLLGSALLNMGEEEKALDLFISAAAGVPQDAFLAEDILELQGHASTDLIVQYFLKVISLLEQFPVPDLVISMAETAIAMCPEGHKERATLSYILFSYHLKLGHNEDAYTAMMSNPDVSRRKDSLRRFLVTLFDRGELSELAGYPYTDMIDEVENIIESRARSADLSVNNYYDFLYSFHVTRQNFRKAAQVMFECGYRLGTELCNLDGLKKQVQAYLSCINCLHLVNKKYQWLIKKLATVADSPKRMHDGEEKEQLRSLGFEVVELEEIKKQLVLSQARLKLTLTANSSSQGCMPVSPGLSPAETVGFLTTANLYLSAVQICQEFKLPVVSVAEALATKAVRLTTAKAAEKSAAWQWLAENRPGGTDIPSDCAVSATWNLLKHIVESKEKPGETVLHRVVTVRLFSLRADLPPWLVAGYKKRDAAELIRLYHAQGKLEAAVDLAVEYLEAVMGNGAEYFGLEAGLMVNQRPSWVPWTVLDRLFLELRDNVGIPSFASAMKRLEASVDKYLNTVDRVSRDILASRA